MATQVKAARPLRLGLQRFVLRRPQVRRVKICRLDPRRLEYGRVMPGWLELRLLGFAAAPRVATIRTLSLRSNRSETL